MAKTYAAFYLPPEEPTKPKVNEGLVSKFSNALTGAWKNVSQIVSNNDYEMLKDIARNMNIQGGTEFSQRYAVGALTKIINGQAVTNKTMLDSLFNTYAPALNAGLAQTGFNSLVEMKNAAQAGNGKINVANFVQGFSNGLSIVQSVAEKFNYSKYGEEIPIDVVEEYSSEYNNIVPQQSIGEDDDKKNYISDIKYVKIILNAHVKNENAELWSVNDFSSKITDCMYNKTSVILRLGKSIFEHCYICAFKPIIKSIYDISFKSELFYDYQLNNQANSNKNGTYTVNPQSRELKNLLSDEKFIGIIKGSET